MTRLSALSSKFLPKIRSILFSLNRGFKLQESGYVFILFLATLPVLLFGTKYVLDQMTANQVNIEKGTGTETSYYKRCAKEAALAVAKNWNPGLTLGQQQEAVYKVADAVYDDSPCYSDSIVGEALAGLDVKNSYTVSQTGSKFNPIKVTHAVVVPKKTIPYKTSTKYLNRRYYYMYNGGTPWNPNFGLWRAIDGATRPSYRQSKFDEVSASERLKVNYVLDHHDIYAMPSMAYLGHICKLYNGVYYPNDTYHSPTCSSDHSRFVISVMDTSTSIGNYSPCNILSGVNCNNYSNPSSNFTVRTPSFGAGSVKISVIKDSINNEDGIQVETDSDKGYSGTTAWAKPAECDVDIVLAIPVNGAANNANNQDAASDTSGTPVNDVTATTSIPNLIKNTPIYQMGQKCKEFVKKFYHTRGVTMGLIPYSAKVSLSPDKVNYTTAITPFVSSNDREYQQKMIGSCLYATSGVRNANLTQSYKTKSLVTNQTLPTTDTCYYWGGQLTGCPIMCRRGSLDYYTDYSGNYSARGLLWNATSPNNNSNHYYRYMRMNLNPCYMGYANLLSMKCEKQCTHFLPNPYYIIEPTSDMVKIYEMCNALYPIYDKQNVSNFIFIPVEWAYNFWQSWTNDVTTSTVTGTGSSAVLERKSKTTSGRKKALVLLVNKPDWFEPGELTYLGFDNDASEIPMAESDKIDFSIDYSDTTKKFLDGSSYNTDYTSTTGEFKGISNKNSDGTPLIAGPKKIIKYQKISGNMARDADTGLFDDVDGTSKIRLKIPRPAQVKITVASASHGISRNWKYYPQALNPSGQTAYTSYWGSCYYSSRFSPLLAYGNGRFVCLNYNYNVSAWSEDGVTWNRGNNPGTSSWYAFGWNGTNFVAINYSKYVSYSADGNSWTPYGSVSIPLYGCFCQNGGLVWDTQNNKFYITDDYGYACTTTSTTGTSGWTRIATSGCNPSSTHTKAYGNGYYIQYYSGIRYSTNGTSWHNVGQLAQSKYGCMTFGNGTFYVICYDGTLICSSNPTSLSSWKYLDGSNASQTSLNKVSGRSDWTAVCYGDGKLVAVSQYGDVAVTKVRTTTNSTTTSTIQSNSLPSTSAYTITNLTTLTVDPSKITETDDEGNYIIDFTCTNLELISAEVTNCIVSTVNPINVTYKDADFDGGNSILSWNSRSVSEAARTINLMNSSPTSSDGYCVEMNDSTGKLKIASDQMKYVSGKGWVPKHTNQDVLLKITSNHGGALTLNVGKWDNGTVTFYKDNIGDTSDVHRDSLSGTTVALPSQQIITTDDQKFVFSGGKMPASGSGSYGGSVTSTYGANFSHNLSIKKVKYSLSSATITGCTLRNQIIRCYLGMYGKSKSSTKALLLSNGDNATQCNNTSAYSFYAMYGNTGSISVGSSIDTNVSKFSDTCLRIEDSTYTLTASNSYYIGYYVNNSSLNIRAYGIVPSFKYAVTAINGGSGTDIGYYSTSGTQINGLSTSNDQWGVSSYSSDSPYTDYVKIYLYNQNGGKIQQYYIQNTIDKTLQLDENNDPIIVTTNPITYQDLIENKGIYIYDPQDGTNTKWICFQGDGELEVTTKPEERDGSYYVKYNTSQTNVTSDSQDYSASWYSSSNDSYDSNCDSDGPLYHTYILLHNVYLKSVTQAAGNKTVRILRSTKNQDIKLAIGPNTNNGFSWTFSCNTSYSYMRQGVTYGNGMFVLVGGQNSSGSGSFYAIGSNGHIYLSTPDAFRGVAYDEDDAYFYAVTAAGNIYRANRSGNALTSWTLYKSGGCPISGINRIACGNGHIVVQNTSAQSATLDKQTLTWSGVVSQPATCYALCFGAGKFICMSYSTSSKIYSSPDGSSWTQIGSTSFRSYQAYSVCYGNGRFLATDYYGYSINISTDGGSTWNRAYSTNYTRYIYDICYGFYGFFGIYGSYNSTGTSSNYYYLWCFYPRLSGSEYKSNRWQVKIGSRSPQQITSRTMFTIAASELTQSGSYYYVDVNIDAGYRRLRCATTGHTTSATVDDLIDFNSGERNGKNGILQAMGSYTSDNGYCVANGAPNVSSSHRGRFELRYARSLGNSDSTGMSTSTIQKTSMTHSNGRYYYNWNLGTSYVLLYLRFYHEPEMLYPYDMENSLNLDWRNNSLGIPSGLSVSSYSNYNTTYGYHQLKTSSCSPTMYRQYMSNHPYTSDISAVLDVKNPMLANITMPEYTNAGQTHLNGITRLFSQQKRDSSYTYCSLQPYSTTYDNVSNLISTNFTIPQNRILTANSYQTSAMTPTAAVAKVTADACTKLKNAYGNDLRIYVVKYKPQEKYNSFPYQNQASVATAHDYTTVDNCASSSSYLYTASSEDELKTRLEAIENDIKNNFANYKAAEIME